MHITNNHSWGCRLNEKPELLLDSGVGLLFSNHHPMPEQKKRRWGYGSSDGLIDVAFISTSIYNPPARFSFTLFIRCRRYSIASHDRRAYNKCTRCSVCVCVYLCPAIKLQRYYQHIYSHRAVLIDLYIRSNWWAEALNKCEECS